MVQSISRNMRFYQNELAKVDMVLVDEADQAGSKQYQNVLTRLFNTRVRIGLSGTIYMSKLAKDKVKNMNLEVFFGKVLAEFKLKDSIKKGYSTRTIVSMVIGNQKKYPIRKYMMILLPSISMQREWFILDLNGILNKIDILHS